MSDDESDNETYRSRITGQVNVTEAPDTLDARIVFKETPSPSANAALVAVTTLPQTKETNAWATSLQIIGSAEREQLVLWEAELSVPGASIPSPFDPSASRDGLLAMVQRVQKEQDDKKTASQGRWAAHIGGLYTLIGGLAVLLIGILIGKMWS